MQPDRGYELIDAGDERRLERFGPVIADRPAASAAGPRRDPAAWPAAEARYEGMRAGGAGRWALARALPEPWVVQLEGSTFELRPTDTGQVGVFPEHAAHWRWLADRVAERSTADLVEVLHLFAYTGGASLAMAAAGARVVHVDASRPAVAWARRNAELSGLGDRPIRWLVDDAGAFVAREARRGRRYAGLVLDPPSYGHGPRGESWHLATDLDPLLTAAAGLLAADAFLLLTAHTPGEDGERLARRLLIARRGDGTGVDAGELALTAQSGTQLALGAWARVGGPG